MRTLFKMIIFICGVSLVIPIGSLAIQPDAEFLAREKQFGKQWATEDKQVHEKLEALEKKFGKKPNIIFILADDIGYTELGSYGGGKVRGFSTPNLDRMADEGMRLLSFYSEPSCTPTRTALMTGRHPVRVGLLGVLFPGTSGMGLVDEEVTVAELLAKAGYHTGMFGKWHLGDEPGMTPIEQGFDEAVWSEGNPPWWGFHRGVKRTDNAGYVNMGAFAWAPGPENFPYDTGGIMRGKKGQKAEMVAPFSLELYNTMDTDVADGVIDAAGISATLKPALEIVRPAGWITKVGWGRKPLDFSLFDIEFAEFGQKSFLRVDEILVGQSQGPAWQEHFCRRIPGTGQHRCF